MATRTRYRHGLAHYNPRAVMAARYRKGVEGPKQAAKRERLTRAKGRLPKPGTAAGRAAASRLAPRTAEWTALRNGALGWSLTRKHEYEGYPELLTEYEDEHYRRLYKERQAERVAHGTIKGRKPRPRSPWVRVRAYRRRKPHGRR